MTVPCGESKVVKFHCDSNESCVGYELSLDAHPC